MSGATLELDFLGMEKENSSKSQFRRLFDHRRTVQGTQNSISMINPEILKNMIGSGGVNRSGDVKLQENNGFLKQEMVFRPNGVLLASENPFSVPSTPKGDQSLISSLPIFNPTPRVTSECPSGTPTAPLTIFFNGTVSIFNVPHDRAEMIMKLAEEVNMKTVESVSLPSTDNHKLLEQLNGDLPIARKKSLQRFLEKRKERLTSVSPYAASGTAECVVEKKFD